MIPYKNAEYKVLAILKGKTAQMQELNTGNKFKLGPNDNLYGSLIKARNNPVALENALENELNPVAKEKFEQKSQMEMAETEESAPRRMKR